MERHRDSANQSQIETECVRIRERNRDSDLEVGGRTAKSVISPGCESRKQGWP